MQPVSDRLHPALAHRGRREPPPGVRLHDQLDQPDLRTRGLCGVLTPDVDNPDGGSYGSREELPGEHHHAGGPRRTHGPEA